MANNATTTRTIKKIPLELETIVNEGADNSFLTASSTNQYYFKTGTTVKVLGSGATDSVTIWYVAVHTNLTAGFTTDILIDAQYWEIILELALYYAMLERPSELNNAKGKNALDTAMNAIQSLAKK